LKNKNKKDKSAKSKNGTSAFYRVIYKIFSGIVGLVLRIKVVGRENEPEQGGYVVCANHISATDPISLCYAFRKNQVHFMAKKELFKIPVLSWLIKMLGAFPVDRSGNDVGAIKTAISLVGDGGCLGIFPQGHRYPGVEPCETELKNGAGLIAYRTKADVVPVCIKTKKHKYSIFRKTEIIFGKPIPYSSLELKLGGNAEYDNATKIIFSKILELGGFNALPAPLANEEDKA